MLREVQGELARLQEDALFSGEYDAGDAVVTIQSDAGGTDAQDWAEILLRMYLRWAEQRGLKTEVIESSPGEEYGHQVGDVHDPGRERVRDPQGRARQAPARPPQPVRPGAPPSHELRAGDRRAAARGGGERSRSTTTTSASTRTARRAPAAST